MCTRRGASILEAPSPSHGTGSACSEAPADLSGKGPIFQPSVDGPMIDLTGMPPTESFSTFPPYVETFMKSRFSALAPWKLRVLVRPRSTPSEKISFS